MTHQNKEHSLEWHCGEINKGETIKPKRYLNSQQQFDKLIKEKNIKLDVDRKEALLFVKQRNYSKIFPPFKDLLVDYNFDNSKPIKSKNKRILREYEQGLRVPIDVKHGVNIDVITKHLKSGKTNKSKYKTNNTFGELINFTLNNDEVSSKVFNKYQKIEPILKTVISNFVGNRSSILNMTWFDYLLHITGKDHKDNTVILLNSIYDEIYKNFTNKTNPKRYKKIQLNIWDIIDDLNLGQLKDIIILIMYSKLLNNIKRKFCKVLFCDILGAELDNFKYSDLKVKLISLKNLRNSIMHIEPISSFYLKERVRFLKIESKNENFRFWFRVNTFNDQSVSYLLSNYNKLGYLNVSGISKTFTLNNLKLGYFLEIEELETGNIQSLDLNILEVLDWWFKGIK